MLTSKPLRGVTVPEYSSIPRIHDALAQAFEFFGASLEQAKEGPKLVSATVATT